MLDAYSTPISAAPAATLGTVYDSNPPRRFPGGMLQQAASSSNKSMGTFDAQSARSASTEAPTPRAEGESKADVPSGVIDPALSGLSPPRTPSTTDQEGAADRLQEMWVENIRVVEALRKVIAHRLEHGDYEDGSDDGDNDAVDHDHDGVRAMGPREEEPASQRVELLKESKSLYPVLRAIETSG
jgi:hypothetical protein